ncbi:hypothetical protein Dimus_006955 [Dionaea muscipula]
MLGDFINRGLVMILGYVYPAFECFKTVEKNRVEIEELRFWCQYWIIVAVLSVIERFGDLLISWLPLYAELKLVFIIYLWYPKTKGTSYVYESFLQPFVSKHETDIDRRLQELRVRAWDLAIYYLQNCTQLGQSAFFEVVHYIANQSSRLKGSITSTTVSQENDQNQPTRGPPRPPPPPTPSNDDNNVAAVSSPRRWRNNDPAPPTTRHRANNQTGYLPSAPPLPSTLFRAEAAESPKSKVVVMRAGDEQIGYVHSEEVVPVKKEDNDVDSKARRPKGPKPEKSADDESLHLARLRLRRSKPDL